MRIHCATPSLNIRLHTLLYLKLHGENCRSNEGRAGKRNNVSLELDNDSVTSVNGK